MRRLFVIFAGKAKIMEIPYGEIIGWAGGSAVVISGFIAWIGQLYHSNRIEKWRSKTESKLKILENELSEKSHILNSLIDVQKSNYSAGQEKRIGSIEKIWISLEGLKNSISSIIPFLYNGVTAEEIEELNSDQLTDSSNLLLKQLKEVDFNSFFSTSIDFNRALFSERPFIGEEVYFSLQSYNFFLGRTMYLLQSGIKKRNVKHWTNDHSTIDLLKSIFPEHQINAIVQSEINSYDMISFLYEDKVIEEINDVLSGKIASNKSLENFKIIQSAISDLNIKTAP